MELPPGVRHVTDYFSLHLTQTHIIYTHSLTLTSPLSPSLPPPPHTHPSVLKGKRLSEHPGLKDTCLEMFSQRIRSPFLLSLLVDMYEEEVGQGKQESLGKALEVGGVTVSVASDLPISSFDELIGSGMQYCNDLNVM